MNSKHSAIYDVLYIGEKGRECVCVCVCEREREREREGGGGGDKIWYLQCKENKSMLVLVRHTFNGVHSEKSKQS